MFHYSHRDLGHMDQESQLNNKLILQVTGFMYIFFTEVGYTVKYAIFLYQYESLGFNPRKL